MTESATPACEVWLRRPRSDEAGALASMIAPLLDRDADELEAALRAGPVQAARDLPLAEANQLAEVLLGFGAVAEVRSARAPSDREPPVVARGTRPFDAAALRASLADRSTDEPRSRPSMRDTRTTPPVASRPPEVERDRVELSTPPVPSLPNRFEGSTRRITPSKPETGEPTQVAPIDDEIIRLAIQAAEAAEAEKRRTPGQLSSGRRSRPPEVDAPRSSQPAVAPPPPPPPLEVAPVGAPISARPSQPDPAQPGAPVSARPSQPSLPDAQPRPSVPDSLPGPSLPGAPISARPSQPGPAASQPTAPISARPSQPGTMGAPSLSGMLPPTGEVDRARTDLPAAIVTTAETALKGRVVLPKSMQSRDDLPPWFPKMPMRPEPPPSRSKLPLVLFVVGLVALAGAVLFVVLQN